MQEGAFFVRLDDVLHRPRGEDCCALDPHTVQVRLRIRRGACRRAEMIYSWNKYTWTQERERMAMPRVMEDSEYDYFACTLTGEDTRLAYIFLLEGADGPWFYCEEGLSRAYDHKTAYFNFFQYSFIHACDVFPVIPWVEGGGAYQIFPERYCNGMGEKPYVTCAWDADPTPKSFYGGDIPGIRMHLDELEELGVSCLYLTPVFTSPSNHKYDIVDYLDVDPAFGGKAALRALVEDAHARGIRVILDGVFNHCSSRHPFFQDVVKRGKASAYGHWFFIDGDFPSEAKGNYRTFAAVPSMPKLNTGHPEVIAYFCEVACFWIREFGIDGWRLDVCDELSDVFLRALRQAVKQAKADAVIIGEIWHDGSHWLRGDMLDGVMNYSFTKACLDYVVAGELTAQGFCDRVIRAWWRLSAPAARMQMNLVGSHDTERFLTRVGGDKGLFKMAYAAAFMMPGMVSVYYGDEVGVTGGYDPGCRKGYPWDEKKQDGELRAFIRALYQLKKQPALARGDFRMEAENGLAVMERSAPGQRVRLYLNKSDQGKQTKQGHPVAPQSCLMVIEERGKVRFLPGQAKGEER